MIARSRSFGFCYWLLFAFVSNHVKSSADLSSLKFIQVLFRHGDRNPASVFPSDVFNNASTWKGGLGELSPLGVSQQYSLGKYIMKRYKGFLSPSYNAKEIHIRSTGYNRTIMSAIANLAGMYPPVKDEILHENLTWQPIPVHSRPKHLDPTLWMDKPCPVVAQIYDNDVYTSEAYLKLERENAEFLSFLHYKTGRNSTRLADLWAIFDPLNCEYIHKNEHNWPDWMNDTVFNRLTELYRLSVTFYYNSPRIQRLRGGMLFYELASRMLQKIENQSDFIRELKYFAYSIHDTTQYAILENMGAFDGSLSPYNQILFLELHSSNNNNNNSYIVKLFKRNSTSDLAIPVNIGACGEPCFIETFVSAALSKKPGDWYKECGLNAGRFLNDNAEQIVGILAATTMLFFVLFLVILGMYSKLRKSSWIPLDR